MVCNHSLTYQFDTESRRSHWDRRRYWVLHMFLHSNRQGYTALPREWRDKFVHTYTVYV